MSVVLILLERILNLKDNKKFTYDWSKTRNFVKNYEIFDLFQFRSSVATTEIDF